MLPTAVLLKSKDVPKTQKATLLLLVGLFSFPILEVEVVISNMVAVLYKIQIAIRSLLFT